MTASDPKVFISYRRRDAAGHAGRLYDAMAAQFQNHNVFMDVDMAPGVDFVERITQAVGACHVLVVVMGPRWANILDEEGHVRIAEREDFVRLEVETALRRADVTVIPVLVAGAQMPEPAGLPEGLRALTRRNALELSDMRWRYDVERLLDTLRKLLPGSAVPEPVPSPPIPPPVPPERAERPERVRPWFQLLLEGLLVAVVAVLAARGLGDAVRGERGDEKVSKIVYDIVWRAETWMLVGATLAVWLMLLRGERRGLVGRGLVGLIVGALAGGLAGAAYSVPANLIADLSKEQIHLISDISFAVLGGVLGAMIGAFWIPRRLLVGLAAGTVAGFLQHALWLNLGWHGRMASVAFECFVIVGAILGVLLAQDGLSASGAKRAGPRTTATGAG